MVRLAGPPPGAPRVDRARLRARTQRVLGALGHARSELSVSLVDDAEMARLNRAFRGRDRSTDVLSFSLLEGEFARHRGRLLGEVVIGIGVAARQARAAHRALEDRLARLVIHGVLHLLGHDHARAAEARRMRREERRLWGMLAR